MLHFSKTAGYAIHALSCIGAARPGARLVRDIADSTQLKKPYLSKIINQLVRYGLLEAKRGYRGGVSLARPPERISLLQIVQAIEGDAQASPCLFGLKRCPARKRCPAHSRWHKMGKEIEATLRGTMLSAMMAATPAPHGPPRNGSPARPPGRPTPK